MQNLPSAHNYVKHTIETTRWMSNDLILQPRYLGTTPRYEDRAVTESSYKEVASNILQATSYFPTNQSKLSLTVAKVTTSSSSSYTGERDELASATLASTLTTATSIELDIASSGFTDRFHINSTILPRQMQHPVHKVQIPDSHPWRKGPGWSRASSMGNTHSAQSQPPLCSSEKPKKQRKKSFKSDYLMMHLFLTITMSGLCTIYTKCTF